MIGKYHSKSRLTGFLLIVISFAFNHSCVQDEFKQPVRVNLSVMITDQYKTSDTITIESGEIVINKIQFDGEREAGGNYFFVSESGKKFGPLFFNTQSSAQPELARFDLPQGVYTLMKWKFELSDSLQRFNQNDDDEDDDNDNEHNQATTAGLILLGRYTDPDGEILKVRIEIDPFESFECIAVNDTSDRNINIISGNEYNAVLYIDPYYAFRAISPESLDDADCSEDETSEVLLISSQSNEELYEIILYRLQQSVKIVII
jgi:hypothetical protein